MTKFPDRTVIKLKPNAVITKHYTSPKTVKDPSVTGIVSAIEDKENHCFRFELNGIPYSVDCKDVEIDADKTARVNRYNKPQ